MKYEKYLIKKEKLDLLSSLKLLDKKIINEKLKEYGLKNINELKDYIIEEFETCLDMSKDDKFTQMYFIRLLEHENSEWMSAYEQDIEDLLVFVYDNGEHYSYYIPTEIKTIIKNMLKEMSSEEQFNLQNAANTPIVKDLNLLLGNIPYGNKSEAEAVKLNILNILNQKYDITEADLLSSELEVVPAFKARSLGFDGSMVAAYGQDDKVCAYTSLKAMMSLENVKTTAICILSDKEEIGSMGNTGMESHVFDYFISELLNKTGENRTNLLDKVFCFSKMLSADVDAGFDPLYASVSDRHNAGYLGKGISLNKYTGARGKSGASDANAEYVAWVRNVLEKNDIKYQVAELGKVDVGGGGTIAYILANKGVDVIDCGIPLLSMHSPYEVTSKFDIYSAYRTYKSFWEE